MIPEMTKYEVVVSSLTMNMTGIARMRIWKIDTMVAVICSLCKLLMPCNVGQIQRIQKATNNKSKECHQKQVSRSPRCAASYRTSSAIIIICRCSTNQPIPLLRYPGILNNTNKCTTLSPRLAHPIHSCHDSYLFRTNIL